MKISRLIVTLSALLFAVLGLSFWFAPEQTAVRFGLAASGTAGTTALRAELGGLFMGLALLAGTAARTDRRPWIAATATVLTAIVVGRLIAWVSNGRIGADAVDLAIEVVVITALVGAAVSRTGAPLRAGAGRVSRRAVVGVLLVLVVVGGSAALFNPNVVQAMFERGARQRTAAVKTAPLTDDALRIAVCGSSAPLPSASRAKPCVAVFAGGKFYVVDAGPESTENLVTWGIPLSSVGAVLLTHFHSDHIGDLGELNLQTWANGRPGPLDVYGGPGVERVVEGFNGAYRLDQGYRTAHHGQRVMPAAAWPMRAHTVDLEGDPTPAKNRTAVVLDDGALRITAIEVDHAPITPAYAYRFDYKGRSVVITGDLKYHPPLTVAARGADLLLSEAIATSMIRALGSGAQQAGRDRTAAIMHDLEDYHITPAQAAQIANDAQVQLLAFYHLLPAPDTVLTRRLFAQGLAEARQGDWAIADDGTLYTLPIGSKRIEIGRIDD